MVATAAGVEVLDVRPPSRVAEREELQVVAQVTSFTCENALRADRVMTRPFFVIKEEETLFRSVLLPLQFSLDRALRQATWLADRACGVVTSRMGLAVKSTRSRLRGDNKLVQPENNSKFLGELKVASGLPLSWVPDAVTDFLAGWDVNTSRQGYRRTTRIQHDFGLAVSNASSRAEEDRKRINFY